MPHFIIHIGPHKTGSTYLQAALAALSGNLRERGVYYPTDLGTKGHDRLAKYLAAADEPAVLPARIAACVRSGCATVVLTAEDLSQLERPRIARLRELIGDHPATVVFYCRAWGQVVQSQWNQHVRGGHTLSLAAFTGTHLRHPHTSGSINYARKLDPWSELFGPAAIRLVCLEALAHADFETLAHFAATFLGLASLPPLAPTPIRRNSSVSPLDAELIRALNEIHHARTGRRDQHMAKQYLTFKRVLPIQTTLAKARACLDTLSFDERHPDLMHLHRTLFATYGDRVVSPALPGQFFTPQTRALKFVRPDYLDNPVVRAELEDSYQKLALPEPPPLSQQT